MAPDGPYLLHPIEEKTAGAACRVVFPHHAPPFGVADCVVTLPGAGLYTSPVAVLDFASLYPSIFMAHNLCYSTLVHPDDVSLVDEANTITSASGAIFVRPNLRQGLVPTLLRGLVCARTAVKQQMKRLAQGDGHNSSSSLLAVLNARQLALKVRVRCSCVALLRVL